MESRESEGCVDMSKGCVDSLEGVLAGGGVVVARSDYGAEWMAGSQR